MSKKQKQDKSIAEQRDFLRTVELAILELPRSDKQILFDCWQNNTPPPDYLREYCRAFIDAVSISPKIADVLKQPRSMAITKEHAENQTPQQRAEIERFVIDRIALFRATGEDARQYIKAAILDKEQGEKLTDNEKYILGNVWAVLKVAEHNAAILQSIFDLDNNQINAAIKEARQAEYIAIPIPEDEAGALTYGSAELSPSLPGLEENTPPCAHRYPAPPFIYTPTTIIPTAELARNIHNLPLQPTITGKGAIAEIGVDARPHKHYVYMLMLDALEREYPIQPIDKTILIALGNLYGERKRAGVTGIQDGAIITAEDVIKRYRGLESTADVTQELIDAVTARMDALSKMRVAFDFTQHFEYRKKHIGDGVEVELDIPDDLRQIDSKTGTVIRFSYNGNMIHANTIEVEYSTGRVARAWEILRPPIVFDYAQKIKQVATIETKLLDLRTKANSSKNADVMKFYLIERINAMIDARTHQPKPDFSQSIMLDSVFEAMRIDINNRKTKKQKVDTIKNILQHFKTTKDKHRGTFIKDFCEIKGYRGALTGFDVIF